MGRPTLGTGDVLHLVKDASATGNGLYILGALTGLTLTGNEVTNIIDPNGIMMYYLASANTGLTGTYSLEDGGSLVPYRVAAAVPVPPALWLLGTGIGLIGVVRRRLFG